MKEFSSERIGLKVNVLRDRKINCLRAHAIFSPEILQAGAAKGLKELYFADTHHRSLSASLGCDDGRAGRATLFREPTRGTSLCVSKT